MSFDTLFAIYVDQKVETPLNFDAKKWMSHFDRGNSYNVQLSVYNILSLIFMISL